MGRVFLEKEKRSPETQGVREDIRPAVCGQLVPEWQRMDAGVAGLKHFANLGRHLHEDARVQEARIVSAVVHPPRPKDDARRQIHD